MKSRIIVSTSTIHCKTKTANSSADGLGIFIVLRGMCKLNVRRECHTMTVCLCGCWLIVHLWIVLYIYKYELWPETEKHRPKNILWRTVEYEGYASPGTKASKLYESLVRWRCWCKSIILHALFDVTDALEILGQPKNPRQALYFSASPAVTDRQTHRRHRSVVYASSVYRRTGA